MSAKKTTELTPSADSLEVRTRLVAGIPPVRGPKIGESLRTVGVSPILALEPGEGTITVPLSVEEESATNPFSAGTAPAARLGTAPGLATFGRLCDVP